MKRIIAMLAVLFCLSLMLTDAEAARVGGGRSSGVQRNNVMQRQATPPAAPANQAGAAKPAQPAPAAAPVPPPAPSGMSRWLGPLAGLAIGAGLMSMFSGGGLGGGMGGLLMMVLLAAGAYFLFASWRKRNATQQPLQYAAAGSQGSQPGWRDEPQGASAATMPFGGGSSAIAAPVAAMALNDKGVIVPEGFDKDAFLRQAKVNFMRLQAANDRKDLHDIRNFTTPEMYAEISLEAQERGAVPQETDVTDLNAELLDVTEGSEEHLASVRFFGNMRQAANAESEAFNEVWHLAKPANGQTGWLLAGIQQYT